MSAAWGSRNQLPRKQIYLQKQVRCLSSMGCICLPAQWHCLRLAMAVSGWALLEAGTGGCTWNRKAHGTPSGWENLSPVLQEKYLNRATHSHALCGLPVAVAALTSPRPALSLLERAPWTSHAFAAIASTWNDDINGLQSEHPGQGSSLQHFSSRKKSFTPGKYQSSPLFMGKSQSHSVSRDSSYFFSHTFLLYMSQICNFCSPVNSIEQNMPKVMNIMLCSPC